MALVAVLGSVSRLEQQASRRYGALTGRSVRCTLTGRTFVGLPVTTSLFNATTTTVPLAERDTVIGLVPSTNGITIPAGVSPREYRIRYAVRITGSIAEKFDLFVRVNGANALTANGYGTALTIAGTFEKTLYAGDVVTLAVKSYQTTGSIQASDHSDVYLTVESVERGRVTPTYLGWTKNDPPGLEGLREVNGMNLASSTWDLKWPLGNGTDAFEVWLAANPDRRSDTISDIACSFIPHKQGGLNFDAAHDSVVAGERDAALQALGVALATYATDTVYIRPWWEMNITGYRPTAAKFIAAWNYAIPVIRTAFNGAARPGQTLQILWCIGGEEADPEPWWPGGTNVDVISVDTYGKKFGNVTPTLGQVVNGMRADLNYLCALGAKYGKPIAISEWANWGIYTDGSTHSYGLGDSPEIVDLVLDRMEQAGVLYAQYWNTAGGVNDVGQTLADTPNSLARFIARRAQLSRRVSA